MATVTIELATVTRIIEGYGFKATEKFKLKNGETAERWFTVWTKEPVKIGDVLIVEGDLSVKVDEYINRNNEPVKSAEIHVNNAMVTSALTAEDVPF